MRDGPESAKFHVVAKTNVIIGPNRVKATSKRRRGKMIELPMRCG